MTDNRESIGGLRRGEVIAFAIILVPLFIYGAILIWLAAR